jgi:hypothetical protein
LISALPPGQTAFDNPPISTLVFKKRLEGLLHNIRNGVYFRGAKVNYIINSIEYQHRGLPHSHIVFQLENVPADLDEKINWCDNYVSARLPSDSETNSSEDYVYKAAVQKFMLHKHSSHDQVNGCLDADGHYRKSFHDTIILPRTMIDGNGFPHYKRLNDSDLLVVPHNREILMDWDGHACCEFSGTAITVLYLYKYLFKGQKKVKVTFHQRDGSHACDDIYHRDEHGMYIRGRKLNSMDAMWRTYRYKTYPASHPTVKVVKVRTPEFIQSFRNVDKLTELDLYFHRPDNCEDLMFSDFFQQYVMSRRSQRTGIAVK